MNCEKCGREIPSNATFCEYCGAQMPEKTQECAFDAHETHSAEVVRQENLPRGILGAVLGALIGGCVIVLLGQLGLIASLSGYVLAYCTLYGFAKLGGGLSKKGIVISLLLMVVTPYLADRVGWAIEIMQAYGGISFFQAFEYVHDIVAAHELEETYIKDLLFVYAFTALGAFTTIKQALKARKEAA